MGRILEYLGLSFINLLVGGDQFGEATHRSKRYGGSETLAATQGSAANRFLIIAVFTSEDFHARGRSTSPSGGPNQPQGNARRSTKSSGTIVIMDHELTRSNNYGATSAYLKTSEA